MPSGYFVLDADQSVPIVGHISDGNELALANKFTRGHSLGPDEVPRDLSVRVELGPESYPDLFVLQRTPIASRMFVDRLRAAGIDNVEAYPAPILEAERRLDGYFVLNVVGRLSCLDTSASEFTLFRSKVFRVRRLAVDDTRTRGAHLFRPHEFELLLLASAHCVQAVQGLSGILVSPADGWSDAAWY